MGFFRKLFLKSNNYNGSLYDDYYYEFSESDKIEKKYEKVVNMHYKLLEKIRMNYTIVNNLGDEFSPQMDSVIQECERDIAIAQEFYNYCKEKAEYYKEPIENYIPE